MRTNAKPFVNVTLIFGICSELRSGRKKNLHYGLIMKSQHNSLWNFGLLVWLLVILGAVYQILHVADKLPYGMHQWRQCDAYSLALNYFEEDRSIDEPAMHFIHGASDGEVVGEFTGTYWLNAQLWKAVGLQPWTMRWTHLFLWLSGIVSLYLLGREWIGKKGSAWTVSVVMVSPLMAFYGPNYLVNGAALGLVYVSWWWSYRFYQSGKWKAFVVSVVALSLALLLRPTMAIGLVPLGLAFFQTRFKWSWFSMLLSPLVITGAWVAWSQGINAKAESIYYCTTIRPLWEAADPVTTWTSFRELMIPEWYHRLVLWSALIGFVFGSFMMLRKLNYSMQSRRSYLGLSALFMILALGFYILLWFSNLDVHDYYLIEFQLAVPVFLAWLLYKPEQWLQSQRVRSSLSIVVLPALLVFQSVESSLRTRMKHVEPSGWLSEQFLPARERELWNWFHWDYDFRLGDLQGLGEHLRIMGIERTDRVISVPDPSPNITLSLIDVRGFTDLYDDGFEGDERIALYVSKGAGVLICNDQSWYDLHEKSPWLTAPIESYGSFLLFDLKASKAFHDRELISTP